MVPTTVSRPGETLDDFVEAYEAAQTSGEEVDLTQFLPERNHLLYPRVLRELVRVDLEYGWQRGRPRRLADYQRLFPDLFGDPSAVQEIAFEEYRLRHQAGEQPVATEYERAFGVRTAGWPEPCRPPHPGTASADPAAAALMPELGSEFLGFRLLAELGRGGFGRVYLAQQPGLGDRLVALKVSTDLATEARALARLQHANIMPIYSVHVATPLQALCMPFLGSTTLADVLRDLRGHDSLPTSGKGLVSTLHDRTRKVGQPATETEGLARPPHTDNVPPCSAHPPRAAELEPSPNQQPPDNLEKLSRLTYVDAVLCLAERLADGLAHAHDHGVLHRDLKPANVLLTDEGEPMLLDFNLSAARTQWANPTTAAVGGTLPYMAAEHLEALDGGARAVDERSDLYSLGLILYELLTSRHPFPLRRGRVSDILPAMIADRDQPPPLVRCWNPAVSPAVESIVRHLLEPKPGRRYQSARDLREDLERQLSGRPLCHALDPRQSSGLGNGFGGTRD
jgi:serine/threonine protein kinase